MLGICCGIYGISHPVVCHVNTVSFSECCYYIIPRPPGDGGFSFKIPRGTPGRGILKLRIPRGPRGGGFFKVTGDGISSSRVNKNACDQKLLQLTIHTYSIRMIFKSEQHFVIV